MRQPTGSGRTNLVISSNEMAAAHVNDEHLSMRRILEGFGLLLNRGRTIGPFIPWHSSRDPYEQLGLCPLPSTEEST